MRLRRGLQAVPDTAAEITEDFAAVPPDASEPGARVSLAFDFERRLLRQSVEQLTAERTRCADCGRTPLIGEDLHLYEGGEIVCELCRQLRREPPVDSSPVRHSELGQMVRLRRGAL